MAYTIPLPDGYSLNTARSLLQRGPHDPVNRMDLSGRYLRRFLAPDRVLGIKQVRHNLNVEILYGKPTSSDGVKQTIHRIFGTDTGFDPTDIIETYPALAAFQHHPLPGYETLFEGLTDIILEQHVRHSIANQARATLIRLYTKPIRIYGIDCHAYPTPECILKAPDQLKHIGISQAKQKTLLSLAEAVSDPLWCQPLFDSATSDTAVHAKLTSLYGIGTWTANWYMLRGLRRFHCLPETDLAIGKAIHWLINHQSDRRNDPDAMATFKTDCLSQASPHTIPNAQRKAPMGLIAYWAMQAYMNHTQAQT